MRRNAERTSPSMKYVSSNWMKCRTLLLAMFPLKKRFLRPSLPNILMKTQVFFSRCPFLCEPHLDEGWEASWMPPKRENIHISNYGINHSSQTGIANYFLYTWIELLGWWMISKFRSFLNFFYFLFWWYNPRFNFDKGKGYLMLIF